MAEKLFVYKREVANCEVGTEVGVVGAGVAVAGAEEGAVVAGVGVAGSGVVAPTPSDRPRPGRCKRKKPDWRLCAKSLRRRQRGQR